MLRTRSSVTMGVLGEYFLLQNGAGSCGISSVAKKSRMAVSDDGQWRYERLFAVDPKAPTPPQKNLDAQPRSKRWTTKCAVAATGNLLRKVNFALQSLIIGSEVGVHLLHRTLVTLIETENSRYAA